MTQEILHYAIECTDKVSGQIGSFAYAEEKPFYATSPVFSHLSEFYTWAHNSGYRGRPGSLGLVLYKTKAP